MCYFNLTLNCFLCSPIYTIWHCFSLEQCEVFIYVSCAQTALLDSKDFLAPVITPFEAVLAFGRYATLLSSNRTQDTCIVCAWLQIYMKGGINLHNFAMVLMPEATCFQGKRVDWRISFGFQGFDHFRETWSTNSGHHGAYLSLIPSSTNECLTHGCFTPRAQWFACTTMFVANQITMPSFLHEQRCRGTYLHLTRHPIY